MKVRVFIDTNVFIYAYEIPESNSAKVIDLLNEGKLEAVISAHVLKEVQTYFKKFYNKELADSFRYYLLRTCIVALPEDIKKEMNTYIQGASATHLLKTSKVFINWIGIKTSSYEY